MSKTLSEMLAGFDAQTRKMAEEILGNLSEDEIVLSRCMSNMAVDACAGDKAQAKAYMEGICAEFPAVGRLFGRVGWSLMQSREATKQ